MATWHPPAPSIFALLTARCRAQGDRPAVTFRDERSGERTELSYATLHNWTAKIANLLVSDHEVGPGSRVLAVLGSHWTTPPVALAVWAAGAALVAVDADGDPTWVEEARVVAPDLVIAREDVAEGCTADLAIGTGMAGRLTREVGGVALTEDALAFGDDFVFDPEDLDAAALVAVRRRRGRLPQPVTLSQRNLLAAGAGVVEVLGLGPNARLLEAVSLVGVRSFGAGLMGTILAGGTLVAVRGADDASLARIAATERVTHVLSGPDLGLPEIGGVGIAEAGCAVGLGADSVLPGQVQACREGDGVVLEGPLVAGGRVVLDGAVWELVDSAAGPLLRRRS